MPQEQVVRTLVSWGYGNKDRLHEGKDSSAAHLGAGDGELRADKLDGLGV